MTDAPKKIWTDYFMANKLFLAFSDPPVNEFNDCRDEYILAAEHERLMAKARNEALEEAAKVAIFHLERLPNYNRHTENDLADKVEEGYGNACINIAAAIRAMKEE